MFCVMFVLGVLGGQQRASGPIVIHMWVLRIEPQSFRRAAMLFTEPSL